MTPPDLDSGRRRGHGIADHDLIIDRIVRRYGPLTAVDRVDLAVPAGERHAIIGPNGAGKTTLLNLIAGTIRPTAGRIRLARRDLTRHGAARRARFGIGRTFQQPACLPTLSVLDNLRLAGWQQSATSPWRKPGRAELTRRGLDLLQQFGIEDLAARPAGELAHGQRRLLDIAAALAGQPALLLLDEPAAGLVDADLHRVLTLLRELPEPMTVLLVEHNLDVVAALADRITVLHYGRILTTGTPDEIHGHPEVRQVYLGADSNDTIRNATC